MGRSGLVVYIVRRGRISNMTEAIDKFHLFVRQQWQNLYALGRQYVGDAHEAQELVQETLLRAWRSFSDDPDRPYSRAWLIVILRRVAIDWSRAAERRVDLVPVPVSELTDLVTDDLGEAFAPFAAMDETRFCEYLDENITRALRRLEPSYREVVLMSVAGGLSYREIAEVLECPVGTVMSRMGRARRALREQLASFAKETGWIKGGRS